MIPYVDAPPGATAGEVRCEASTLPVIGERTALLDVCACAFRARARNSKPKQCCDLFGGVYDCFRISTSLKHRSSYRERPREASRRSPWGR